MNDLISNGVKVGWGLPGPAVCQVWIDFDGTITKKDVLDELILRYSVDDSWKVIERQWQAGLIGSRQCLQEQFALLRVSQAELTRTLDDVELDDGIFPLLKVLEKFSVPVTVLSDCVDVFIKRVFERHGITNLRFRSNGTVHRGEHLELCCPHANLKCQAGAAHCKCASAEALGNAERKSIYIGDGRSDLCPACKAHFVFAKNALAACLKEESVDFIRYRTLHDVVKVLSDSWHPETHGVAPYCGTEERAD